MYVQCAIEHSRDQPAVDTIAVLDTGLTNSAISSTMALAHAMELERCLFTINGVEATGHVLPQGATIRVADNKWPLPAFRAMDHKKYSCLGKDFLKGHVLDFGTKQATFRSGRRSVVVPFLYQKKGAKERQYERLDGSLVAAPREKTAPEGEEALAKALTDTLTEALTEASTEALSEADGPFSLEMLRTMMSAASPESGDITLQDVERILFLS